MIVINENDYKEVGFTTFRADMLNGAYIDAIITLHEGNPVDPYNVTLILYKNADGEKRRYAVCCGKSEDLEMAIFYMIQDKIRWGL